MITRTARTIKNYLTGLPDVRNYTRRVAIAIDFASFAVDIQHDLARPQAALEPKSRQRRSALSAQRHCHRCTAHPHVRGDIAG